MQHLSEVVASLESFEFLVPELAMMTAAQGLERLTTICG
ncbi:hypothetical protein FOQG_18181 [Fusarium oxysporum f. sp. raphani 54005]|uniref:Uncharacterized protein n=2 Tax=Fusarium oxysporum TaxID=5507 RepID=X0BF43_FUSOX|nr:hypothetical protein FOQG_18181 [Fusarium oxysporum f. sp. raphani 54005]EXM13474.1 hypothetical protein FOTG_18074 [Fusarium oxysporum f. sp. vasinfectum 25433]